MTLADWDAAYRLLLRGMLQMLETSFHRCERSVWGRIVALTSTAVKQPIDKLALSNAFRSALVAALRTLAVEVAKDGVTVNCIATGRVETARLRALYGNDEKRCTMQRPTCRSAGSLRLRSSRQWSVSYAATQPAT